jgi:hypothetical protein
VVYLNPTHFTDSGGLRDIHREQLSIEHSMQDLDSAVGRLDNILMSLYVVIAALIIAVALVQYSPYSTFYRF